jgi:hypothetical protein
MYNPIEQNIGVFYEDERWGNEYYCLLLSELNDAVKYEFNNKIIVKGGITIEFFEINDVRWKNQKFDRIVFQKGLASNVQDMIRAQLVDTNRIVEVAET